MRYAQKTSCLGLALLATTMLTQPAPARAAPNDALGPEFRVNTTTSLEQRLPAVAMDADGDFVVAWTSDGQDTSYGGVYAQRYDAAGVAQGPEFRVNSFITLSQLSPTVAMDTDGDFVVAWSGNGLGDNLGIFARRFDAAGTAQGAEFLVNSFTTGNQTAPAVAMDADGDFVVAWSGSGADDTSGVLARRYDAAGAAQGTEFLVNTYTTDGQLNPTVAMDAEGNFVVAWQSFGQDTSSYGVYAQRYNAVAVAQDTEFRVNTFTERRQLLPAVAMDADGDFVVAWQSYLQTGNFDDVFAQRYDAAGAKQGTEFQVNTFIASSQAFPAVAMDADGDFLVVWTDYYGLDGSSKGVFAQRYDAAGAPQGSEFHVNAFTTGNQIAPAVAMDPDGDFVVAWQSYLQDYSSYGIFAQRYDGAERIVADFDGDGNADTLWRNTSTGNTVIWLMEGKRRLAAQSIGAPPLVWQIVGIGEFNGDNKADILWHNTTTGAAVVWQMDGFVREAVANIGAPPTAWAVEKVEDTNGDGLSDIFWRNTTSGATVVWQMLGFTKVAVGPTGGVDAAWQVQ